MQIYVKSKFLVAFTAPCKVRGKSKNEILRIYFTANREVVTTGCDFPQQ